MNNTFDGDTSSANIALLDDSIEEVKNLLNNRNYYVGTNGEISFSLNTDTVEYLMKAMTGHPTSED